MWVVVQGVLRSGEGWSVRWSRRSPSPACSALAAPWQRVGSPPCLVRCRSATHSSARRPRTALGIAAWTCAARRGSRCAPPAPGGSPTPGCSPAEGSSWCSTPQGYARRTSRCRPRSGSGSRSGRVRRWGGWQSAIRDALAPACTGGCCAARPTSTRCRCWGPRMCACFPPERRSPAKDRPTLAARDRCGTRRRSSAESPARYRVGRLSASGRPPHRDSRCARPIGPGGWLPLSPSWSGWACWSCPDHLVRVLRNDDHRPGRGHRPVGPCPYPFGHQHRTGGWSIWGASEPGGGQAEPGRGSPDSPPAQPRRRPWPRRMRQQEARCAPR